MGEEIDWAWDQLKSFDFIDQRQRDLMAIQRGKLDFAVCSSCQKKNLPDPVLNSREYHIVTTPDKWDTLIYLPTMTHVCAWSEFNFEMQGDTFKASMEFREF